MPKKACCCKTNCCEDIFYTNFIVLAGETMDDAAPVHPNDVIVLTMNRGQGAANFPPSTVYGTCPGGTVPLSCPCTDCEWLRANFCGGEVICPTCETDFQNCKNIFAGFGCGNLT